MTIVIDTLRQIITSAELNDITGNWLNGDAKGMALFSYSADFGRLWGLASVDGLQGIANKLYQVKNKRVVVIVWDSIPKGNTGAVNTSRYLTPIDWAVALSLNIRREAKKLHKGKEESLELPALRIVILDLGSHQVPGADAMKVLPHLALEMPWVEVLRPDGNGLDTFLEEIVGQRTAVKFMNDSKTSTDVIQRLWRSTLVKPSELGDHHAIANLVGPLLLLGEDPKDDSHVKALRSLMSALVLIPEKGEDDRKKLPMERSLFPWIRTDEPIGKKLEELTKDGGQLRLILVDDQFQQGWGKMLCWAVNILYNEKPGIGPLIPIGTSGSISVKAASSVDWLVKKLDAAKDQRFEFCMDDSDNNTGVLDILFLDLRLFSGQPLGKEIEFFTDLIVIAKKFTEEKNLAWPAFDKKEIKRIEKWSNPLNKNKKREDAEYIESLTLLPRILSLTDMSLPIILFSSTGRRDLTEKFKPYGNIITVFEKPRLSVDIPEDIAEQTKMKFQEVLEEALQILQARQKCKLISSIAARKSLNIDSTKGIHIELFIDECLEETSVNLANLPSKIVFPEEMKEMVYYNENNKRLIFKGKMKGTDRDTLISLSMDSKYRQAVQTLYARSHNQDEVYVGGLFAIFAGRQERADQFDDDLIINDVRYFDSLGIGVQRTSTGIRNKKVSSAKDLSRTMTSSTHKPDCLGFIGLRHLLSKTMPEFDLFNPKSADNLFRMTLTALLESFLCETLPALFDSMAEEVSISIYTGTRVKYYGNKSEVNRAMFHFGSTSFPAGKGYLLHSVHRDSVCPIISDIVDFHNIKRKIYRAVGVTLPYKDGPVEFPEYFICRNCKETFSVRKTERDSISVILKCSCGGTAKFSPDYKALHYIADEILNHMEDVYTGSHYGEDIKKVLGGFDDELNDDLKACIFASRSLDSGDIVSSITNVNIDATTSVEHQYKVKPLLVSRIALHLNKLKGEDFCKIAKLLDKR